MPTPKSAVNVGNPVLLAAGPMSLYDLSVVNATGNPVYVQLFNQAAAASVTLASMTPDREYLVPAGSAGIPFCPQLPANGLAFSAGCVAAVTQQDRGGSQIQAGVSLYYSM